MLSCWGRCHNFFDALSFGLYDVQKCKSAQILALKPFGNSLDSCLIFVHVPHNDHLFFIPQNDLLFVLEKIWIFSIQKLWESSHWDLCFAIDMQAGKWLEIWIHLLEGIFNFCYRFSFFLFGFDFFYSVHHIIKFIHLFLFFCFFHLSHLFSLKVISSFYNLQKPLIPNI